MKRRTAPEIIAFVLGWDWNEVKDNIYQPTRYTAPRVYSIDDFFMCSPTGRQKLPTDLGEWIPFGIAYGRTVYRSKEEV